MIMLCGGRVVGQCKSCGPRGRSRVDLVDCNGDRATEAGQSADELVFAHCGTERHRRRRQDAVLLRPQSSPFPLFDGVSAMSNH